jgi:hypothetical protein
MNLEEMGRIVEEQAALRRVAMFVAHGAPPAEVFNAVASEMGRVTGVDYTIIGRYCPDNTLTVVATWERMLGAGRTPPVGSIWPLDPNSTSGQVARTGRPTRVRYDSATGEIARWATAHGCQSGVGCPILVEGRLWGVAVLEWTIECLRWITSQTACQSAPMDAKSISVRFFIDSCQESGPPFMTALTFVSTAHRWRLRVDASILPYLATISYGTSGRLPKACG